MENSFLTPGQHEAISTGSDYFKPSDGLTKVRVLTPPIQFFGVWVKDGGEPVKHSSMLEKELEALATKDDKVKRTWGLVVWDYATGNVLPWEVTQVSIINALISFHNAGLNPLTFDLNILRTGEKLQTKYTLQPLTPTPLDALALDIVEAHTFNMDGFVDGTEIVIA